MVQGGDELSTPIPAICQVEGCLDVCAPRAVPGKDLLLPVPCHSSLSLRPPHVELSASRTGQGRGGHGLNTRICSICSRVGVTQRMDLPKSNSRKGRMLRREWPWWRGIRVADIIWKVGVEYGYGVSWAQILVL